MSEDESAEDYESLVRAKRGEMVAAGVCNPSENAMCKAITKEELARHWRRTNPGGPREQRNLSRHCVPVLQEDIMEIWAEQ